LRVAGLKEKEEASSQRNVVNTVNIKNSIICEKEPE